MVGGPLWGIQELLIDSISVWIRRTSSLVMAIWVLNLRLELYLSSDEDPKTNLNLIWDQIKTKRMAIWGYSSDKIYLCSQIKFQKISDRDPQKGFWFLFEKRKFGLKTVFGKKNVGWKKFWVQILGLGTGVWRKENNDGNSGPLMSLLVDHLQRRRSC